MKLLPLLLIPLVLQAQKPDGNWILTFADEFNGSELDLLHWSPHDPWGHERDRQLQAWAPGSISVSGGQLHLIAQRTSEEKPVRYDGKEREYVSGIATTFGAFAQTYGRFEIRCRIPAGNGLRPSAALYPVPLGPIPRIDVFTVSGNTPSTVSFANYWGTEQTERSFGDSFPSPNLSKAFHTIAVEWDSSRIIWFLDGKEIFRSTDGIPHMPMFLVVELAVGGGSGSLATRFPDETTAFPASFDIDYVRVYRRP